MSRLGTLARRTFLIGTAAVAGGVAFGYYQYRKEGPNPLLPDLPEDGAALTPYVRIDQSGVTIITPRAEMGQGVYTALAALVAEELDVAWQDINVDHGPPSATYYNGKVAAEGFPFAATDISTTAQNMRAFGDVMGKFLGLQATGGSSTVPDGFEKMRIAGAAARDVLLEAASQKSKIPKDKLKTKDGAVVLPDGKQLSYPSLAVAAADITPPTGVKLKPRSKWRYLGKSMPRVDMADKCTGKAQFGIDVRLPDMVYATVRTNPRLGGGVKNYDVTEAKKVKGVQKIVPITAGVGVIANNTWQAFKAANKIKFEWGQAPYLTSNAEMLKDAAASFVEDRQDSQFRNDGDVETALKDGKVTEAEYKIPYLAHAPLEPMNAVVLLKDNKLDIWVGTQVPMQVVTDAAALTGFDAQDISVHIEMMGGSFGRRLETDFIKQAIEVAKAVPGKPVKMTWTREEDMTHDLPRPIAIARLRGTVEDRQVDTFDARVASPAVGVSQMARLGVSLPGPDTTIVQGIWDQPFAIPNYRVTGYRVPETVPISSWRSVGASGNGFFHECFLDELIHAAGADPLKERIRLANHVPSRKVLEAVAEMCNWGTNLGKDRGRGVAFTLSFGVPVAEVVDVSMTEDGVRIDKVYAVVDVGTVLDPRNLESQVTGGILWGLSHAIMSEITYKDGAAQQTNFHQYDGIRMKQTPAVEVRALENGDDIRGIGEPGVPPAAPALANAIFNLTGKRIRELPLNKSIEFA